MIQAVSNSFQERVAQPAHALNNLGQKVALFAYFLFQAIVSLFTLHLRQLYWDSKNYIHLKKANPLIFSPYLNENHGFGELFSELLNEFQALNKLSDSPIKKINGMLRQGFCHGEVLTLVQMVKELGGSLFTQIETLSTKKNQIALFEILEIFRYTFEMHNREDLLQKIQSFSFQEGSLTKDYSVIQNAVEDLKGFQGEVVVRIHDGYSGHSLVLSLDPHCHTFGFYNPKHLTGYYEYGSLEDLFSALSEHARCHHFYQPQWQLSF